MTPNPEQQQGWIEWWLGLNQLNWNDPDVELGWQWPLPMWAWLLIIVGMAALTWLSYRRLTVSTAGPRITLGIVRAIILIFVVMLISGPVAILKQENIERDQVLFLVDRSESMSVRDLADSVDATARMSRDDQLQSIIAKHAPNWQSLAEDHDVAWLGFSERLAVFPDAESLGEPTGQTTALKSGIDAALKHIGAKPLSSIVVFSDGRSTEQVSLSTLAALTQRAAPVFTVPLGATDLPMDLTIARVEAPDRAYINDVVPVQVTVEQTGESATPPNAKVQLIDTTTKQVMDEHPVTDWKTPIRMLVSPKLAGTTTWRVNLTSDADELVLDNNTRNIEINLVDRPINVLYAEGYPRWEYRYLKNLLIREKSIDSSIILVSADRDFAQEGNTALRRLPRTHEELKKYDVVIIGDIPSKYFTSRQLALFRDHIAMGGAGILWLAGEVSTPGSYKNTPLEDILPMPLNTPWSRLDAPIDLRPTPASQSLGMLRIAGATVSSSQTWESIPSLFWAQKFLKFKPATETLAIDQETETPLIVRMRFGAGQSLYVATDEIWRWRFGRGETYPQQFWMPLIRLLARNRLHTDPSSQGRAILNVSHSRAAVGDTLVVELKLTDQALLTGQPQTVNVEVHPENPGDEQTAKESVLLTPTERDGVYRGEWSPVRAGQMVLRVNEPALSDVQVEQRVMIDRMDNELRDPSTNHALLADLAKQTGGQVLTDEDLSKLSSLIPNRSRRTVADVSEQIWSSPLAFLILALLLTAEWIGRKMIQLA